MEKVEIFTDNRLDFSLRHPFTFSVVGMTGCGKTSLVLSLVERRREVISVELEKIIYIYSENQPKFEEFQLKHPNLVIFSQDMEEIRGITSENKLNTLIILDDKMLDISGQENEEIISWFIKGSSHRNCSIIILLHSMFPPKMRTISINTKYMVMYSNPRDRLTIWNLGRQMFPGRPQFLPSAYEKAVAFPFGYLFFDFHHLTNAKYRLRSSIYPQPNCRVYALPGE
jgi:hypothetical protein